MPLKIAPAALALLTLAVAPALHAQSSPAHHTPVHHTPAHHTSSQTHRRGAAAADPADNPPGVPPVTSSPKALYSLRYVDIVVGTGPLAQPRMYYSVRYTGWLTDGTKFDSSDDHPGKEPFTFPYGAHRVIPGWDTGFGGMHVGGKRRLYVPYQLAYGESGHPPVIPPKSDLIFDIELVSMSETPPGALERTPPPQPAAPTSPSAPAAPSGQPGDPAKPSTTPPPAATSPGTPEKPNPPSR